MPADATEQTSDLAPPTDETPKGDAPKQDTALDSDVESKGEDTGIVDDSYSYCIEKVNNHWFIGWDTNIVSEGRSISSITKDSNDNIIITLSDGTTKNVGSLKINIQGDFLTSDGFGNLRYYNDHFQYYDKSGNF